MRSYAIKMVSFLAVLLMLGMLGACAQRAGRGTPSSVADRDAMFMRDASAGSIAEVRLGQLAMQNAASEEVKRFASSMVNDHTVADQQLRTLAERKNVDLPAKPDERHERVADRLSRLQGPEFDRQYMAEMVKDHERTVSQFQNQSSAGQDPDVKAFADKNLPILQQHLDHAKALHGRTAR